MKTIDSHVTASDKKKKKRSTHCLQEAPAENLSAPQSQRQSSVAGGQNSTHPQTESTPRHFGGLSLVRRRLEALSARRARAGGRAGWLAGWLADNEFTFG